MEQQWLIVTDLSKQRDFDADRKTIQKINSTDFWKFIQLEQIINILVQICISFPSNKKNYKEQKFYKTCHKEQETLKSAIKNGTGVTLRLSSSTVGDDWNKFSNDILLTFW